MFLRHNLYTFVTGVIIFMATTGCVVERLYNPGPSATYLEIPGIAEIPLDDPRLDQVK